MGLNKLGKRICATFAPSAHDYEGHVIGRSDLLLVAIHLRIDPGEKRGNSSIEARQTRSGATNSGADDADQLVAASVRAILDYHGTSGVALECESEEKEEEEALEG